MKKKQLKAKAFRYWCNMLVSTSQRIQAEEENTKLQADIEQLQSDMCAEVDELNQVIEAQRVMLGAAQGQMRILLEQNTRLLVCGGGWAPVLVAQQVACACAGEACDAELYIDSDGENLTVSAHGAAISFILPDNMRVCVSAK